MEDLIAADSLNLKNYYYKYKKDLKRLFKSHNLIDSDSSDTCYLIRLEFKS